MKDFWDETDTKDFFDDDFAIDCLYFQARLSPKLRQGVTRLDSDTVYGYTYYDPVPVKLMRTAINYRMYNVEYGRIYEGGARFTIPTYEYSSGDARRSTVYDRIFKGDIIVIEDRPIRDYDVLRKGYRDTLFAFDVKEILSVISVLRDNTEKQYTYGTDYKIRVDGNDASVEITSDGTIKLESIEGIKIASTIEIVWLEDGDKPVNGDYYAVEFMCSPNYVVFDELAKPRMTSDRDLPKSIMCVKRAFFNKLPNPIDDTENRNAILGSPDKVYDDYDDQ